MDQIFNMCQMDENAQEKNQRVYDDFVNLEEVYYKVEREALWKVQSIYDVDGKKLTGIRPIYVNSVGCLKQKEGKNKFFLMIVM